MTDRYTNKEDADLIDEFNYVLAPPKPVLNSAIKMLAKAIKKILEADDD